MNIAPKMSPKDAMVVHIAEEEEWFKLKLLMLFEISVNTVPHIVHIFGRHYNLRGIAHVQGFVKFLRCP